MMGSMTFIADVIDVYRILFTDAITVYIFFNCILQLWIQSWMHVERMGDLYIGFPTHGSPAEA